jgi:glutamyl-Q tRNA(Asp) synthetase
VVNAVFVWGLARALSGRVLLRIEDHDRGRARAEYDRALLEDLAWLGLEPDEGRARQSEDIQEYANRLARLTVSHHVYVCDCSRRQLGTGPCRERALPPGPGRGVRLELPPGLERFDDALLGTQTQEPAAQCGDLLLRDRTGNWTYQFAVVVDDLRQGVNLVIRGADLLDSTGRQLVLGRLLGRSAPPVFLHHPLILRQSGEKLSKSSRDTGIRELRHAGWSAERVLGKAAFQGGLLPKAHRLGSDELGGLFMSQTAA